MVIATNTFQAVAFVGWPEAEIILSQCTVYLASSAKSNASYVAIKQAKKLVQQTGDLPVPAAATKCPHGLHEGGRATEQGYQYAHDYPQNFVAQEFLPETLSGITLYQPR